MGETARSRNHQGNPLAIPPEERGNRGAHLGNFSREGANSYGSACQTSRNVQKQGWQTAGIYRRFTRNLHQRQKGAGLQRGRKPARYTDKRGESDSSSRSRIRQQRGLRAAHHHQEEPARTRHRGELRLPLRLLREQQPRPRPYLHPRQNDLLRQTGLRQLAGNMERTGHRHKLRKRQPGRR